MLDKFAKAHPTLFPMERDRISTHCRKQLGINVGALREGRGLSQSDLALRAGVSRCYVNQVENARCNITFDIMIKLADGLGVPLSLLFAGLDQCPPSEALSYDYAIAKLPR